MKDYLKRLPEYNVAIFKASTPMGKAIMLFSALFFIGAVVGGIILGGFWGGFLVMAGISTALVDFMVMPLMILLSDRVIQQEQALAFINAIDEAFDDVELADEQEDF